MTFVWTQPAVGLRPQEPVEAPFLLSRLEQSLRDSGPARQAASAGLETSEAVQQLHESSRQFIGKLIEKLGQAGLPVGPDEESVSRYRYLITQTVPPAVTLNKEDGSSDLIAPQEAQAYLLEHPHAAVRFVQTGVRHEQGQSISLQSPKIVVFELDPAKTPPDAKEWLRELEGAVFQMDSILKGYYPFASAGPEGEMTVEQAARKIHAAFAAGSVTHYSIPPYDDFHRRSIEQRVLSRPLDDLLEQVSEQGMKLLSVLPVADKADLIRVSPDQGTLSVDQARARILQLFADGQAVYLRYPFKGTDLELWIEGTVLTTGIEKDLVGVFKDQPVKLELQGDTIKILAASAGLEEEQVGRWYSNWFYRVSGETFLQDLNNRGVLPPGFSIDNYELQVRLGRLLGRWGIGRWIGHEFLRELLKGSEDGVRDLQAIERFVAVVRGLPKSDFYGEQLKGVTWDEPRNKRQDPRRKSPTSTWSTAKPLLNLAMRYVRRYGGFRVEYTPSIVERKGFEMNYSEFYGPFPTVTILEPASIRVVQADSLPAAGLEGGGVQRIALVGTSRELINAVHRTLLSVRPTLQIAIAILPEMETKIAGWFSDPDQAPEGIVVAGTVALTGQKEVGAAVDAAVANDIPVTFMGDPDEVLADEVLGDLDMYAGLEEAGMEEPPMKIWPVEQIIGQLGLRPSEFELYGSYIAKIRAEKALARLANRKPGKLVIVTGITPTPAGEGKTTISIGLLDGLAALGVPAVAALREPSLGPVFGKKGPATGAGRSQLYPGRRINLSFTGDFTAVNDANNLLLEAFYNQIFYRQRPQTDAANVTFRYSIDLNARSLRDIRIIVGKGKQKEEQGQGFILTAASEVMAVLALAKDHADLERRLGQIIVAWRADGTPITAREVGAVESMMGLLEYAAMPNLVQTYEGNPVLVHAGPFANIAHGTSSVIATRLGLTLVGENGLVIQETGFGADLGFEKYADVVSRQSGLTPDAVVLVASAKALKWHGGVEKEDDLKNPNVGAVRAGFSNLDAHLKNIIGFGVPVVVAINAFPDDTPQELQAIQDHLTQMGIPHAVSTAVKDGSSGSDHLAYAVWDTVQTKPAHFHPLYALEQPVEEKLRAVAKMYGADDIQLTDQAVADISRVRTAGFGNLPVIIAKTPASLSDDPSKRGVPTGWRLAVKSVSVSGGAEFLRVDVGEEPPLLMPGLGEQLRKLPPAEGEIVHSAGLEAPAPVSSSTFTWASPWQQRFSSLQAIVYDGLVQVPGSEAAAVQLADARLMPYLDLESNGQALDRVLRVPRLRAEEASVVSPITLWVQEGVVLPAALRAGVVIRALPLELNGQALEELNIANPGDLFFLNSDESDPTQQGQWATELSARGLFGLWVSPASATFQGLTPDDVATIVAIMKISGGSLYILDLRSDEESVFVYLRSA
ncbi:MAG: formate--tetrahydrofolate ligase [Candidatus Omnitrophica bacterium]|nr:formate--tetrahydrofolate ligase [Candidatus Omnitrophota bacterium]